MTDRVRVYDIIGTAEAVDAAVRVVDQEGFIGIRMPMPTEQPPVVTLCGSGRFSQEYKDAALMFGLMDSVVLSIACDHDTFAAASLTAEQKDSLDRLHLAKIQMADFVFVLNVDGYIGQSTALEIIWASLCEKPFFFHDRTRVPANLDDVALIAKGTPPETMELMHDTDRYPWDGVLRREFGIVL